MLPASLGAGPAPPAATGAHADLLRIVRELNRLVVTAQIPATLAAQVFIEDPQLRREVLRIMDLLNTMTGAPLVAQHMQTGLTNLRQAPPQARGQTLRGAAGDVGLELLVQSVPALRALLTRR